MQILQRLLSRVVRHFMPSTIDLSSTLAGDAKWHQDLIVHIASIVKPKLYVELGIFHCGLFNRMIPFAEQLVGVDASADAGVFMTKSPKARFVHATTDDFARQLRTGPIAIDLLFIDADHSKEAVENDFRNFLPFVRPHGLILLHDTHPIDQAATIADRCGDGYLAIERLSRESDEFEMMTLPVHPGLTICRKRLRQLDWLERGSR